MSEGLPRLPELPAIPAPERGPASIEGQSERPIPAVDRSTNGEPGAAVAPAPLPRPITPVAPAAPAVLQQVEDILSAGLEETYKKMDPSAQTRFRVEGEKTAVAISTMLQSTKFQVHKVIELILGWLRIIPGVNRFFIEQEAKIKADKILALRQPPST